MYTILLVVLVGVLPPARITGLNSSYTMVWIERTIIL